MGLNRQELLPLCGVNMKEWWKRFNWLEERVRRDRAWSTIVRRVVWMVRIVSIRIMMHMMALGLEALVKFLWKKGLTKLYLQEIVAIPVGWKTALTPPKRVHIKRVYKLISHLYKKILSTTLYLASIREKVRNKCGVYWRTERSILVKRLSKMRILISWWIDPHPNPSRNLNLIQTMTFLRNNREGLAVPLQISPLPREIINATMDRLRHREINNKAHKSRMMSRTLIFPRVWISPMLNMFCHHLNNPQEINNISK